MSNPPVPNNDINKLSYYLKSVLADCGVDILQPDLFEYTQSSLDADLILQIANGKQFSLQSLSFKTVFLDESVDQCQHVPLDEATAQRLTPDPLLLGGLIPVTPTHVLLVNSQWVNTYYREPVERLQGTRLPQNLFVRTSPEEQESEMMDVLSKMKQMMQKRGQEAPEPEPSFTGQGHSLGGGAQTSESAIFGPSTPPTVDPSQPSTKIAVRLLNGKRQVVTLNLSHTVRDLASACDVGDRFTIQHGFPPKTLVDPSQTIEEAGLKGAQVSLQKVE